MVMRESRAIKFLMRNLNYVVGAVTATVFLSIAILLFANATNTLSTYPVLTFNLETHSAQAQNIHYSEQHDLVVTSSADGTVRVWSGETGRALKVIRFPTTKKTRGFLFWKTSYPEYGVDFYASALSPNGQHLAVAGNTTAGGIRKSEPDLFPEQIFIIDITTGEFVERLTDLPYAVLSLEFSFDGKRLAAGIDYGAGVWIWNTDNWTREHVIEHENEGFVWAIDFAPNGDLAVGVDGNHGGLFVYDKNYRPVGLSHIKATGNEFVDIEFAPNGKTIAVSYYDTRAISLFPADLSGDGQILRYEAGYAAYENSSACKATNRADTLDYEPKVLAIEWSEDGHFLYSVSNKGGLLSNREQVFLRKWNIASGDFTETYASEGSIMDLADMGGKGVIFAAYNGAIGGFSNDLVELFPHNPERFTYWKTQPAFRAGNDGMSFEVLTYRKGRPLFNYFDYASRTFHQSHRPTNLPLSVPTTNDGSTDCTCWFETGKDEPIEWRGRRLTTSKDITSCAFAKNAEGDVTKLLLGTHEDIRIIYPDGSSTPDRIVTGVGETAMLNAFSDDIFIAAKANGIVSWHDAHTGDSIANIYLHTDAKRWVIWTDEGFYDSEPDAEQFLGWQINRGIDHQPAHFTIGRFRDFSWQPALIKNRLKRVIIPSTMPMQDVRENSPPIVEMAENVVQGTSESGVANVSFRLASLSHRPIERLLVQTDGKPNLTLDQERRGFDTQDSIEIQVPIDHKTQTISVLAEDDLGRLSDAATVHITGRDRGIGVVPTAPAPSQPTDIFLLAIGVDEYLDSRSLVPLDFAVKDAQTIVDFFSRQQHLPSRSLKYAKLLQNDEATTDAIREEIKNLADVVSSSASQNKLVIVYLSGHGMVRQVASHSEYVFLGYDGLGERGKAQGLEGHDLTYWLSKISSDTVIFIDTCHAGALQTADMQFATYANFDRSLGSLIREANDRHKGAMIFAAATENQLAKEIKQLEHGIFTYLTLRGLSGAAELRLETFARDGFVNSLELREYVEDCFDVANVAQKPVVQSLFGRDFPQVALSVSDPNLKQSLGAEQFSTTKSLCGL